MDMSDKNFDNYFRDRLQDHSSPVPADMWQRIIPEKQRRRKFFFWIWSFAGAILVITGLLVSHRILTPAPQPVTFQHPAEQPEKTASSGNVPSSTPASTTPPSSVPKAPPSSVSPVPTNHPSVPQIQLSPSTLQTNQPGKISPLRRPRAYPISLSPYPISHRPVTARSLPLAPQAPAKQKDKKQKPVLPKWYVDAYFSPDIALIDLREWSYTTGLRFSKQFGPHFSAKIGLQYSSLGEKARLDSGVALHVRLKTLDIPLLAGYETNIGHLATTLTGGIIFNIHSWNTLGPGFITHDIYKTNTGLSLYLGLNFVQPLNKNFSLFAEPYIRYRLSDISNYPEFFDKKMNAAGILLGLRYKH
jgi:hypothetical protein